MSDAQTQVRFIERPDDEFLILGFEANGRTRNEGIEAYLPEDASTDDVLVPLSSVANALSFHIEVDTGDGMATGFIREEANIFQLDLLNEQVLLKDGTFPLRKGGAESHIDDIYVQASLLEDWFDIDINLNFNSLMLEVNSDDALPFQEREERLARAETKLNSFSYGGINTDDAQLLPYGYVSYPSFVFQNSFNSSFSPDQRSYQNNTSLQAYFDFMKFSTDLNLSHLHSSITGNQIQSSRLTFRRQDPKKDILGPLQTGKVEIGDISFPSVPLFGGGGSGAGVLISSDPQLGIQFARDTSDFVLEGNAPIGWDAELYRNGQFLDFKTISDNGLYQFDNIELLDGYNQFKIILYGPEGQKDTLTRDIFRGPNTLGKGELVYDAAVGSARTDFLPLAENANKSTDVTASANVYYGVTDFLTVGANFYDGRESDEEEHDRATTLSVASAFLGMNTQFEILSATEKRRAYSARFLMRPMGFNISGGYKKYENFDDDDQDVRRVADISFSRTFGLLAVALTGQTTRFLDQEDEHEVVARLSTDIWNVKLTNELTKVFSINDGLERFDGDLSLVSSLYGVRLRGNLIYDLEPDAERKFRTLRLSAQKNFQDKSSLLLNSNYDFSSRVLSGNSRYTRQFDQVSIDLNLGASTDDNYSAGVTLRAGLQPSGDSLYSIVDAQRSSQASLGIRAFIDDNDNDQYDLGESLLSEVSFGSSRGSTRSQTNDNGMAWLYGLVEMPTRIHVKHDSLQDIYLVPKQEGYDVLPRKGANITLDYAFVRMGEIDGFVLTENTKEGIDNIPVRVINLKTGKEVFSVDTEYDGYFIFPSLPMGSYEIVASYDWLSEQDGQIVSKRFELTPEEPSIYDLGLYLQPFDENTL